MSTNYLIADNQILQAKLAEAEAENVRLADAVYHIEGEYNVVKDALTAAEIRAVRAEGELEGLQKNYNVVEDDLIKVEEEYARLVEALEALRADVSRTIDLSVDWSEVGFDACSVVISRKTLVKLQAALKGEK